MNQLLDNPCGLFVLSLVVLAAGNAAVANRPNVRTNGTGIAGIGLLLTIVFGLRRGMDLSAVALFAASMGLLLLGTSWIVLSILAGLLSAMTTERNDWAPQEPPPEPEYYEEPEPEPEPPPPPPTDEERAAAARERYEKRCWLLENAGLEPGELSSAIDQAKQKYLQDLDELMR